VAQSNWWRNTGDWTGRGSAKSNTTMTTVTHADNSCTYARSLLCALLYTSCEVDTRLRCWRPSSRTSYLTQQMKPLYSRWQQNGAHWQLFAKLLQPFSYSYQSTELSASCQIDFRLACIKNKRVPSEHRLSLSDAVFRCVIIFDVYTDFCRQPTVSYLTRKRPSATEIGFLSR
jgi:hypothetical protein